jgi:hypothetical protein
MNYLDAMSAEHDREEDELAESYACGEITQAQYNIRMRAIQRERAEDEREETGCHCHNDWSHQ